MNFRFCPSQISLGFLLTMCRCENEPSDSRATRDRLEKKTRNESSFFKLEPSLSLK
ncbi:hypothetical protein Hanom_Chr05g00403121 [Helianthus anomalus]